MDSNNILRADVLDIIFEGRNKEYGAYDLRKTYNRRMIKSLVTMAGIIVLLFTGYFLSGMTPASKKPLQMADDVVLDEYKEKKPEVPPVVPPPVKPLQQVQTIQYTPPVIVHDDQVKPDEHPPVNDDLDKVKIGTVNQTGVEDDGLAAPPASQAGTGVTEAPKPQEDYDKTFTKVEIESSYPGGPQAWLRYMNKNMRVPDEALNNGIEGTVVIQFIVDKEGNVSDVQAVSGPEGGGLREEAMRVIRKSGKWTAAIQNGHTVRSYKRQPIVFQTMSE